ncbi:MAG: hypothetical protein COT25_01100 [Candidatus Kerfeldbacteria bacterium CG08_land_8_20_14_0_20_42_7]|uniref:Calcineurin-like phosphoesterase domain-containing protein n=1 Tax=Candidatus Kerfeldbacteria bacterium CG08_land_8_20_14_0_20_42_7 TaxID=2014245 RepID=A0A2H0YVP5_9BACT|nr:MAG: hypothetical protein COT25_01100 [Candidatus Kerfeldbacteria bacterium CG08_land_8_20_14_0_20_42_7]
MQIKTILFIIVFFALALILLIGGHYLLYYFFIDSYDLYASQFRVILAVVFGIFSIGYILASVIARWSDNLVTRIFYAATAMWLGLILYVAMAAAVTLLVFGLIEYFSGYVSHSILATIFLVVAIAYTAHGLWSAYTLRVEFIEIGIRNLPHTWEGKRIVQISDVHLGHIHGERFFHKLISFIEMQNPAAVFITGDLFDGMGGDFRYIVDDINSIKAPLGIFYIKGNHETYMDFSKVEPLIHKTKATLLRNEVLLVNGLQIAGADYPEFGKKRVIGDFVSRINPALPSILLWHEPIDIEAAKQANVSLVLSGHTHRGQLFPFEWVARGIYKQYEYGLVTDGDFHHYTSSGVGTWGPPIRTGNRPEIVSVTLHKV